MEASTSILNVNHIKANGVSEDFNLNLLEGEIHSIISLKVAELKQLIDYFSGEIVSQHGSFIFNGKRTSPKQLIKDGDVQFILQDERLFDNLTIFENLYINDKSFPRYRKTAYKVAQEVLSCFELRYNLDDLVTTLTVEEKKLLELVKIYLCKPTIVIIFDALSYLTYFRATKFMQIMKALKQEGTSIIYLTNRLEDCIRVSDNITIVTNGKNLGTIDSHQAKHNPSILIRLLAGWEPADNEPEHKTLEVLNTIFRNTDELTSTSEIKHVLNQMAKDIALLLKADGCIMYIVDDKYGNIIDSIIYYDSTTKDVTNLKKECILELIKTEGMHYLSRDDTFFSDLFMMKNDVQTLVGKTISLRGQLKCLIQISYYDAHICTQKEIVYLEAFSKEVAIAMEHSRLVGSSILLQESHHRIKNNLQIVISLLNMQKKYAFNNRERDIFNMLIFRIKTIAKVHELLSRNDSCIGIIYLKEIVKEIVHLYNYEKIKLDLEIDEISIPYNNATSICLILNELICNSIKHASLLEHQCLSISIICKDNKDNIYICVKDNGIGFPDDFVPQTTSSVGLLIIDSITKSFDGSITFGNFNGAQVEIKLSKNKIYNTSII